MENYYSKYFVSRQKRLFTILVQMIAIVYVFIAMSACNGTKQANSTNGEECTSFDYVCPDRNHPHAIDLGLPSGTKWACCNVGANNPIEYGGYYAWGMINESEEYNWGTYVHCDGTRESCHNLGSDISETQYDVAKAKWGEQWKMPNINQIKELYEQCSHQYSNIANIYGVEFIGNNGMKIFMPASSGKNEFKSGPSYSLGYYWSSTQVPNIQQMSYGLAFCERFSESGDELFGWDGLARCVGHLVRPVTK